MNVRLARSAATLALALSALLAAPGARAQIPDIPCEIGRWGGGGFVLPSSFSPATDGAVEEGRLLWGLTTTWDHYTFDRFDGDALPEVRVDLLTAAFDASWKAGDRAFTASLGVPYLWVDDSGSSFEADGIGDLAAGLSVELNPSLGGQRFRLDAEMALTAPTGDENLALGFGDWTVYGGLRGLWRGDDRRNGDREQQVELAIGWRYVAADADLSEVLAQFVYGVRWNRIWLEASLTGAFETGGDVSLPGGGSREAREEVTVGIGVTWRLSPDQNQTEWSLLFGARSELTNDGLADRFTPYIGLQIVRKPRK